MVGVWCFGSVGVVPWECVGVVWVWCLGSVGVWCLGSMGVVGVWCLGSMGVVGVWCIGSVGVVGVWCIGSVGVGVGVVSWEYGGVRGVLGVCGDRLAIHKHGCSLVYILYSCHFVHFPRLKFSFFAIGPNSQNYYMKSDYQHTTACLSTKS